MYSFRRVIIIVWVTSDSSETAGHVLRYLVLCFLSSAAHITVGAHMLKSGVRKGKVGKSACTTAIIQGKHKFCGVGTVFQSYIFYTWSE